MLISVKASWQPKKYTKQLFLLSKNLSAQQLNPIRTHLRVHFLSVAVIALNLPKSEIRANDSHKLNFNFRLAAGSFFNMTAKQIVMPKAKIPGE